MIKIATKGIVFDIDNTLFNRSKPLRLALNSLIGQQYIPKAIEIDANGHGDYLAFTKYIQSHTKDTSDSETTFRFFQERLIANIAPNKELINLIDRLSSKFKLGILSNGSLKAQHEKLDKLKIRNYFSPCIISGELGIEKPNPLIFQKYEQLSDIPAAELLMVGDHHENDIVGAHTCGYQTAWLSRTREYNSSVASVTITNLASLEDILL